MRSKPLWHRGLRGNFMDNDDYSSVTAPKHIVRQTESAHVARDEQLLDDVESQCPALRDLASTERASPPSNVSYRRCSPGGTRSRMARRLSRVAAAAIVASPAVLRGCPTSSTDRMRSVSAGCEARGDPRQTLRLPTSARQATTPPCLGPSAAPGQSWPGLRDSSPQTKSSPREPPVRVVKTVLNGDRATRRYRPTSMRRPARKGQPCQGIKQSPTRAQV
jgi:hypothetical protein